MKAQLAGICLLVIASVAGARPAEWIAPDEVSLGAVRVTDDWLKVNGLDSKFATGILIAWMHDAGTLSDENLKKALIPLVVMLRNGAADWGEMNSLCDVAPKCIEYMAVGSGFSGEEMERHLRRRDLQANTALLKMFAVAHFNHHGQNEWSVVRQARELESAH